MGGVCHGVFENSSGGLEQLDRRGRLHFNKHTSRPILLQSPTSLVALPDHVMKSVPLGDTNELSEVPPTSQGYSPFQHLGYSQHGNGICGVNCKKPGQDKHNSGDALRAMLLWERLTGPPQGQRAFRASLLDQRSVGLAEPKGRKTQHDAGESEGK